MSRLRPIFCKRGGFTLLELLIAMTFVVMLATGIVLSVTTALRVWKLTTDQNDLHQEARAIMELVSRDLRGSYLGLNRDAGFFLGGTPSDELEAAVSTAPTDPLYLTTGSTSAEEASFLPEEVQQQWDQTVERPRSDLMAVRWEWRAGTTGRDAQPEGLYRTTAVVLTRDPEAQPTDPYGTELGLVSQELVSARVKSLHFRYYDGTQWTGAWDSRQQNGAPKQVSVELELWGAEEVATERASGVSNTSSSGERKHVFRTIVTLATS